MAAHDDLIHDIAYDFYGTRLATCSSDQRIKTWTWQQHRGAWQWTLQESWRAHDSSILRVVWAHPEYGNVLASCSLDRTVCVWEEQERPSVTANASVVDSSEMRRWVERARLVDSTGAVLDIDFAPKHLGLKLASVASDGWVRIYEAMDIVDLARWTLMDEIDVDAVTLPAYTNTGTTTASREETTDNKEFSPRYCLACCPGPARFTMPMLAVGGGRDNLVKIFHSIHGKWIICESLSGHEGLVTCIAWAPNLGRSYMMIATGCRDGAVRIFKLTEEAPILTDNTTNAGTVPDSELNIHGDRNVLNTQNGGEAAFSRNSDRYHVHCVAVLRDHEAPVSRVNWNITGTILASAGEDGKVRVWQQAVKQAEPSRRASSAREGTSTTGLGLTGVIGSYDDIMAFGVADLEPEWKCSDIISIEIMSSQSPALIQSSIPRQSQIGLPYAEIDKAGGHLNNGHLQPQQTNRNNDLGLRFSQDQATTMSGVPVNATPTMPQGMPSRTPNVYFNPNGQPRTRTRWPTGPPGTSTPLLTPDTTNIASVSSGQGFLFGVSGARNPAAAIYGNNTAGGFERQRRSFNVGTAVNPNGSGSTGPQRDQEME